MSEKYDHHPKQKAKQRDDFTPEEVAYYTATFNAKNEYLSEYYSKLTPKEFYRGIFPEGTFEHCNNMNEHKPNGILSILVDKERRGRSYNRLLFDDLGMLDYVAGKEFVIASPIAFSGRTRSSKMAYQFYGMAIDLDGVEVDNVKDLIYQMENEVIPMASYIVNSGTGLHIYYVFEYPVPALPAYFDSFNALKKALSEIIWNQYTSTEKKKQFQGIFQGYRVPGTQSKFSEDCIVTAFKVGDKVTVNYLNSFVSDKDKADFDDMNYTSLSEAKELWEDWYNRRIIKNEPVGSYKLSEKEKARRRRWFETWKGKMMKGAYDGNRHYCIGVLFNYAMKAEIPLEEALEYALEMVPEFNKLTTKPGNTFTEDDVYAAEIYYDRKFIKMGRKGIERMTGIDIGETKRNHRSQKDHLKRARAMRDLSLSEQGRSWTDGRPDKRKIIEEWRKNHPSGSKNQCIKETGISKPTVYKWWNLDEYELREQMIKEITALISKNGWHYDLPDHYVIKGDPDMFTKMEQLYNDDVSDISIITKEEEEALKKLNILLEAKHWDDWAEDMAYGMAASKSDALDHSIAGWENKT